MPIIAFKESISAYLKEIDYKAETYNFSPLHTFKNSLLTDPNVAVNIYAKNAFYVQINTNDFNEILTNTFYYNYSRFQEQTKQIEYLKVSTSSAWLLTTIYYACFFAANEITNLHGVYNLTLTEDDKKKLIPRNTSNQDSLVRDFLTKGPTHFEGKAKAIADNNTIQIHFFSGGGKPHELTWNNLKKVLSYGSRASENRLKQLTRIKNILSNIQQWKRPNQIRNEWNYSKPELYLDDGNRHKDTIINFLDNFQSINRWAARTSSKRTNIDDDVISILFLFEILKNTLEEYKLNILN
ncbi:MAG: hypothetical protein V2A75_02255 [Pseudomonadota bacterium]